MKPQTVATKALTIISVISLVAVLTGCSANQSSSEDKTQYSIGLTYIPNIQFAPFYVSKVKGYFSKNINLRHHGANEGLFDGLLSGKEDFVIAGGDEMIQAMGANPALEMLPVSAYYKTYPAKLFVAKTLNADRNNIAQVIKSKTIGIPGKYGENWYALQLFLRSYGLKQSDVNIKEVGYNQTSVMLSGEVGAVIGFTNNDLLQLQAANVEVSTIDLTADSKQVLMPATLITTKKMATQNKEVVAQVVQGLTKGINYTIENPQEALQITAENYVPNLKQNQTVGMKVLEKTVQLFTPENSSTFSPDINTQQCEDTIDFMVQAKMTKNKVSKEICSYKAE